MITLAKQTMDRCDQLAACSEEAGRVTRLFLTPPMHDVHERLRRWMVNVGMQWKLFDGSTRHSSDAISRQALSLKEQRDDLSSMISLQVRQTWLDSKEAQKRIKVTQQAIAQADENMKVTTDRYQQGLATNTEVLDAEDLRTRTHDNFNNASYDAALETLHLRRAVGIL